MCLCRAGAASLPLPGEPWHKGAGRKGPQWTEQEKIAQRIQLLALKPAEAQQF